MKWSGVMRKWINEFEEGDRLHISVMLSNVNRGITAKGAPYLSCVIQDKSGTMDAKYWSVSEDALEIFKPGMIVEVDGDVLNHNKQLQFRIQKMIISEQKDIDLGDYVKSSPLTKAELKNKIQEKLDEIKNPIISKIVQCLLQEFQEDFYTYPAAAKNHHDFVGGLATHVLGMFTLADSICSAYPLLNKDLLYGGIFIHDLGKLIELSGPIVTEYTTEGKLLGHISIMQAHLNNVAQQHNIQGEEVVLLRHMILSHHGVYEYGSPVLPMIPEAEVLYLIDNLDARMNTLGKALAPVAQGQFTPRIFALENRSFYKSKL